MGADASGGRKVVRDGLASSGIEIGVSDRGAGPTSLNLRSSLVVLCLVDLKPCTTLHHRVVDIGSRPVGDITVVNVVTASWAQ